MKPTPSTKVLFYISLSVLAIVTGYLSSQYTTIPEMIPSHFSGKSADTYAPKRLLWLNIVINLIIVLFVGYIVWNPKLFRLKENFLEQNQVKAIKNRQLLLSVLLTIVTFILGLDIFLTIH